MLVDMKVTIKTYVDISYLISKYDEKLENFFIILQP